MKIYHSLYLRFIGFISLSFVGIFIFSGISFYQSIKNEQIIGMAKVEIENYRSDLKEALDWGEPFAKYGKMFSEDMIYIASESSEIEYIAIVDKSGNTLSSGGNISLGEQTIRYFDNEEKTIHINDTFIAIIPVIHKKTVYGYFLVGYYSVDIIKNTLGVVLKITKSLFISVILFLVVLIIFISHYFITPLKRALDKIDEIKSTKDLSLRIEMIRDDEIGKVIASFNQMMQVIEQAKGALEQTLEEREQQFEEVNQTLFPLVETTSHLSYLCQAPLHEIVVSPSQATSTDLVVSELEDGFLVCQQHVSSVETNLSIIRQTLPKALEEAHCYQWIQSDAKHKKGLPHRNAKKKQKAGQLSIALMVQKSFKPLKPMQRPSDGPIRVVIFDGDIDTYLQGLVLSIKILAGFEVAGTYQDADNCLEICKTLQPHIVLMDLHMKRQSDGLEATEKIALAFPHICVAVITLDNYGSLSTRVFRAGGRGVLTKTSLVCEPIAPILTSLADNKLVINGPLSLKHLNFERSSIERLSWKQRLVYEGKLAKEMDKEIAFELDIKEQSAKNHFQKAKENLLYFYHTITPFCL